jgi:hypothetical protein
MKKILFFAGILFLVIPLSLKAQDKKDNLKVVKDTITADSTEYELVVLDPGFETWLLTKPMNMHSESYYESHNRIYVSEWNSRYMNPGLHRDLYETFIDYRPEIHYGLEFNYRLYYYFKYFEEVNGIDLIPGDRSK